MTPADRRTFTSHPGPGSAPTAGGAHAAGGSVPPAQTPAATWSAAAAAARFLPRHAGADAMAPPAPGSNGRTPRDGAVPYPGLWAPRGAAHAGLDRAESGSDTGPARPRRHAVTEPFRVLWDSVLDAFKTFAETAPASHDPGRRHHPAPRRAATRP